MTQAAGPCAHACPQGPQSDRHLLPARLGAVDGEAYSTVLAQPLSVCAATQEP